MLPAPNGFIASPKECLSSLREDRRAAPYTMKSQESERKDSRKIDRSESIRRAEEMLS